MNELHALSACVQHIHEVEMLESYSIAECQHFNEI